MGILQAGILELGCHTLFQGIFSIQGSNPGLPHCRRILYCVSRQGGRIQYPETGLNVILTCRPLPWALPPPTVDPESGMQERAPSSAGGMSAREAL